MDTLKTFGEPLKIKGPEGYIYVEDQGTGEIPVIFLHSFGGSSTHWKNQAGHLRTTRRVITFDFPGNGHSEPSPGNRYSAEALSECISAVADSLKLDRFVLVGHSMGGTAAIEYADSHPKRVAGLVLAGTPGKSSPDQGKAIIASLESDAYDKVMNDYMEQLLNGSSPEVHDKVKKDMEKIPKDVSISIIKALFRYDPLPKLKRYHGPKLIIYTTREAQQPNTLHRQLPEIPAKIFEGTSHWVQLDKPEEFNRLLDDFLAKVK